MELLILYQCTYSTWHVFFSSTRVLLDLLKQGKYIKKCLPGECVWGLKI